MKPRRFTPTEDEFLKREFLNLTLEQLGNALNRNLGSVHGRCLRLGLKIPKQLAIERQSRAARSSTNKGRFKKGHMSHNKGKKGICAPGSEKGWFKPGSVPPNHRPVGTTIISADGYIKIKVSNSFPRWELLHRKVWREHFGPIPKGINIRFKDGNKQNCQPQNLYAVSDAENMVLNTIQRYPPELKKAIRRVGRLKRLLKVQSTM